MIHNPPAEHPDASIRTDPGANGDEMIPDFSVMSVCAMHRCKSSSSGNPRFPALENWERLRIQSAKPLVIAELKRTAPRSAKDVLEFRQKLVFLMRLAMEDAENQARLAFGITLYKLFDEIILIAACGEWWTFRFATRMEMQSEDLWNSLQSPDDSEDDDDMVSYKHPSRGEMQAGPQVSASIRRYTDLRDVTIAECNSNIEDAMPPAGQWSKHILFGTEASNQCLFLIHEWLKQQQGEVHLTYAAKADEVRFTYTFNLKVCSLIEFLVFTRKARKATVM